MAPGGSTVLAAPGFARDVVEARLRGFDEAFAVLRLLPAFLATFFRATFVVALPFVLFLAIDASPSCCTPHIAHRRPLSASQKRETPEAGAP